ncbi:MAG: PAS domain-containing protein, partial [Leeuwenhoekiella sp.]
LIICTGNSISRTADKHKHYVNLFQKDPVPKIIYEFDNLKILDVNEAASTYYGHSKNSFLQLTLRDIFPGNTIDRFIAEQNEVNVQNGFHHFGEFVHYTKEGSQLFIDISGWITSYFNQECMLISCEDITEIKNSHRFKKLERDVMEKAMELSIDLRELLKIYILGLEQIFPDLKASILRVHDNKIYNLACPSLPIEYVNAIEGSTIGAQEGSCGTAAFSKSRVIVSDISTDPLWEKYKDIAIPHELMACWSQPIFNSEKQVIATFANYYPVKKMPSTNELELFERSAALVGIILENHRKGKIIKFGNELYKYVHLAINDAIYDWDFINDNIKWGESFSRLFGYDANDKNFPLSKWAELVHPNDLEKTLKSLNAFTTNSVEERWTAHYRFRKADFSYVHIEEMGYAVRDENGMLIRMIGVLSDISEKLNYVQTLEKQNLRLKEIAWDQSHYVRVPVARLMGLIDLIKNGDIQGIEKEELLLDVLDAAREIDLVIQCISKKTNSEEKFINNSHSPIL